MKKLMQKPHRTVFVSGVSCKTCGGRYADFLTDSFSINDPAFNRLAYSKLPCRTDRGLLS